MNIGRSLKIALAVRGMTQQELADKLGCAQSNISYWVGRQSQVTMSTVDKLATSLDYKVSEFIELGEW
jgi:transcriptional regulator with XRE-family HTH domain